MTSISISLTILWIIAGIALCILEFLVPSAFVELMMGFAALVVAGISLVTSNSVLLVGLWLILSTLFTILSRKFLTPSSKRHYSGDDKEGTIISSIEPGKMGRVLYEGNSWRAKSADPSILISDNENVHIVEIQGNTLIVLPNNYL
ncbi:membrane protein implicated in regulation of membrane protease activity [Xenococcus sp. PCC 7305]|uniref:NfeD family protein n=1 Tax=Xenococcus sp. PCC 7305 TaxID=102125 RepID=UPI0002AC6A3B|nr:NfeD family protein [Xenococcus sp. PCC 7305]ELS02179.1 membrane protein implicated in regulation of membrane protease activity [Xenococcus sp. PCC 7305]